MRMWLKPFVDLDGLRLLDRGTDALVFLERGGTVIKVPRLDSNYSPLHEARVLLRLQYTSRRRLAPRVFSYNPYYLRMERIACPSVDQLLEQGHMDRRSVCLMLEAALELDRLGIDHGEVARPHKHVRICGEDVVFIDFGRASTRRRPRNFTSLASFVLTHSHVLWKGLENRVWSSGGELLGILRNYKKGDPGQAYAFLEAIGCPLPEKESGPGG